MNALIFLVEQPRDTRNLIQFFFSFDEVSERFYTQNQSVGVRNDQDVPFHVILCENVCEGTNVSHHP